MELLFYFLVIIIGGPILLFTAIFGDTTSSSSSSTSYSPSYGRRRYDDYDFYDGDFYDNDSCYPDEAEDYNTSGSGYNYNSYYSQLHDEAMSGDADAIEEMREEFGDDWEGEY